MLLESQYRWRYWRVRDRVSSQDVERLTSMHWLRTVIPRRERRKWTTLVEDSAAASRKWSRILSRSHTLQHNSPRFPKWIILRPFILAFRLSARGMDKGRTNETRMETETGGWWSKIVLFFQDEQKRKKKNNACPKNFSQNFFYSAKLQTGSLTRR